MMPDPDRFYEFPGAITICDATGVIVYMNKRSRQVFAQEGGDRLLGANLLDCHPAAAKTRLQEIMHHQATNVYTIEKGGKKKLIYQSPWYEDGVYRGLVELALELPEHMPHFKRD
jgi:transcriptional regulator with PAS, ATPase and Fis domain